MHSKELSTLNVMDEPQKHTKQKQPATKEYTPYNATYNTSHTTELLYKVQEQPKLPHGDWIQNSGYLGVDGKGVKDTLWGTGNLFNAQVLRNGSNRCTNLELVSTWTKVSNKARPAH